MTLTLTVFAYAGCHRVLLPASQGHTRIPVYEDEPDNVVAILLAKNLLGIGYDKGVTLRYVLDAFHKHGSETKGVLRVPKVCLALPCLALPCLALTRGTHHLEGSTFTSQRDPRALGLHPHPSSTPITRTRQPHL